jgi:hypothetical protein
MKTMIKAALAATVATGLFAAPALAANSATAPFTAKAKIMKPLTLVNDTPLDFGTITMGAGLTSSNVVIGRTGGSATTSCGTNLTCVGGAAATFTVSGVAGQQLNITLSGVPGGLLNTADNTKSVGFTPDPDTTVTLGTGATDLGIGKFDIGGAITVLASTVDGTYENTMNVTVAYQ